ncbi:hypothetical protein [Psychroserpens sp.]|uniref:hypothetical protein n=1 Tax=Psychroserpens sp. TaxID=2020870 RepID=UPI00385F55C9
MKLFSFILSFIFLFQSTGIKANDIIQLDELIEHAQFHNQEYGDNFFVFISKHYGELKSDHNKAHQEEKKEHEQLPFQHNIYVSGISVLSLVSSQKIELTTFELLDHKPHIFFYNESFSSVYTLDILQPPRFI